MSFGDLELHDHYSTFLLVWTKLLPGRVQQPTAYFRGPWDDFMVHGVRSAACASLEYTRQTRMDSGE